jgi:hypothetical protein
MLGHQGRQLASDATAGRAPAGVDDAARGVPSLEPEGEPAVAVGVEADPERREVRDDSGRFVAEDARCRFADRSAAGDDRVAQMPLGSVVGTEGGGQAALRPVARRLGKWSGGDERDPPAVARRAQGRIQAGGARADDRDIGLQGFQGRYRSDSPLAVSGPGRYDSLTAWTVR